MASSLSALRPVNEILSQLAVEAGSTLNEQLIADKVFEKIQLDEGQFTGTILVENSRNYMGAGGADVNFKRSPGAARARLDGFDFTTLTFQTEAHGLEVYLARLHGVEGLLHLESLLRGYGILAYKVGQDQ